MKIGELAKRTDLSIDTIRFYEKKGLLDPKHVQRRANNYRNYTEEAVGRLKLVREAKRLGFSLSE
ncbi:MAG: MerR family transcriptional regulator, partial [Cyanobacteria bacterium P01_A01_bin.17]